METLELIPIASFARATTRNQLVHAYGKIRSASVYERVRASLPLWEKYLQAIAGRLS